MKLPTACCLLLTAAAYGQLPADWNPKAAADRVLQGLVNVTAPPAKGTHDAEFVCVGDRAYIVAQANDENIGHGKGNEYVTLSIATLSPPALEKSIVFARAGQAFANATLPGGYVFVPRIIQKDAKTLRCFFASHPPKEQARTWFIDFDIPSQTFSDSIFPLKLKTAAGVSDFSPAPFHADAARLGFTKKPVDHGIYLFDSFKVFDGKTYIAINNFPGGQNALASVNGALDTLEILGHFNEPQTLRITESAVNRLPDGTWLAVCRQDGGNNNYLFTTSPDGRAWTPCEHRAFVQTGLNAKPTFDRVGDVYYLGWQDNARVNNTGRTVFNVDVSRDGKTWLRKYRFESSTGGFAYPTFHQHRGTVYMTVSDGKASGERIMFGKLE